MSTRGEAESRSRRVGAWAALAALAALVTALAAALALAPTASADISFGSFGEEGGQTNGPRGIDVDRATGTVYVAERRNQRISAFTEDGTFIRAFGWGVVRSGPGNDPRNEIQEVSVDATGGSFTLRPGIFDRIVFGVEPFFNADRTTEPIPHDASAAQVQAALEGTVAFEAGDFSVSGPAGGPWSVEFTGRLADADVRDTDADGSGLSGGAGTATVTTTQQGANFEICEAADGDLCRVGSAGSEDSAPAGKLRGPTDVAVDNDPASPTYRDIYVFAGYNRVQRFTAAGEFVLAFGDGVNQSTGGDVCTAASGDSCGPGSAGDGPGQFTGDSFEEQVAVAPGGTVYVGDDRDAGVQALDARVQSFAPSGTHIALFDPDVTGQTSVSDLEVDAAGDFYLTTATSFGKYDGATGDPLPAPDPIADAGPSLFGFLALDPAGNLYVEASGKFLAYDPAGTIQRVVYEGGRDLVAHSTAQGDLYLTRGIDEFSHIEHFSLPPPGPVVLAGATEATGVGNLAATLNTEVNPEGEATTVHFDYVDEDSYQADLGGGGDGFSGPETQSTPESPPLGSDFLTYPHSFEIPCAGPGEPGCLAPETSYRFRAVATSAEGSDTGPVESFTTLPPLSFGEVYSTKVGLTHATLHAELNPNGIPTTGHFEYVSEADFQTTGFDNAAQLPDVGGGADPIDFGAGEELASRSASLRDLDRDSAYRYRFIATNFFDTYTGPAAAFRTFPPDPEPRTDCPNQQLRTGPSAVLPDCRAYELVTPHDERRNNADIVSAGTLRASDWGYYYQASVDGEAVAYHASTAFADAVSAPYHSAYISRRGPEGWGTHSLNAPRESNVPGKEAARQTSEAFNKIYSPDLSRLWFFHNADPQLEPAGVAGYPNLYRRDDPSGAFTAITTVTPPTTEPATYDPVLTGTSADGTHVVFGANARLTANASTATTTGGAPIGQVYERHPGGLRLVSVLPGGEASDSPFNEGGSGSFFISHVNPVSADGERIFWTQKPTAAATTGKVYVRVGGAETVAVSEAVSAEPALFQAADPEGSRALFTIDDGAGTPGDALYLFDVDAALAAEPDPATLIATGVDGASGFAGASEDLSRIYFSSTEVLDPEPNSHGDTAVEGQNNLYLHTEGEGERFIATFTGGSGGIPSVGGPARVSPDGSALAFNSAQSLTGYDNTGAATGKPAGEVHIYRAGEDELLCATCNPTGNRPRNTSRSDEEQQKGIPNFAAAHMRGWWNAHHPERYLSADGDRLIFEAYDSLLPADTNGLQDIYQWQAPGTGECTTSHAHYFQANGGCLSLLTPGNSPNESIFVDADEDGEDVFFRTAYSIVDHDPGLIDIYVARAGGGLEPPPRAPRPCEGDGCQPPAEEPEADDPASEGFEGSEDPAVPADCRRPTERAQKAEKQAQRAAKQAKHAGRKAKRAKRRAKRASGRKARRLGGKARSARRKAKAAKRAAKRAHRKSSRLGRRAAACRSGGGS